MLECKRCGRSNIEGSHSCEFCGDLFGESGSQFLKILEKPSYIRFPHPPSTVTTPHPVIKKRKNMVGRLTLNDVREFILVGKDEFMIGRADNLSGTQPEIDLTKLDSEMVTSRKHARILKKGEVYFVEDLESTNFTYLNGRMLSPNTPTKLDDGDVIRIGKIYLVYSWTATD
ncbi:MAG: FHA domain-containing protein [Caldisericia bacterium]|nr:FHA domain-containing protein [Caldisericia bacterium]